MPGLTFYFMYLFIGTGCDIVQAGFELDYCIVKSDLELVVFLPSQMLGLQVCVTIPNLKVLEVSHGGFNVFVSQVVFMEKVFMED